MDKNNLISDYFITLFSYKHVFSAAPDIFFEKPCIGYIKKGNANFFYNGATYYAQAGDLIYIAFETKYQSIWYGSPDVEWYSVGFDFYSKYAFYDYRFQIIKNYPSELFEKMYETREKSPMLSVSYFYSLLDDIYSKMQISPHTHFRASVEPAIRYIEDNYADKIPIEKLTGLCHISKSTLFDRFKLLFGVTPIAYKHNIMIQHAIDLLSNTNMSIEEISNAVGFSSSNFFRKIFIKLTGNTPKEIRKK